jgi:hypothetical protein
VLSSQDDGGKRYGGLTVEAAVLVEGGSVCAAEDWAPGTIVHCRTTCTRGSPFFPVTGLNVTMHVSVAGPEGLKQQQRQQQRHQTTNQPSTQGNRKTNERVNRLHRLSDHWPSDRISVLLATVECLCRGGAEGCGCRGGQETEKSPRESEEEAEVRCSMAHG